MATERAKIALKNLRNSTSRKQAMIKAGYSESYAATAQIKQTEGWNELLEKNLPDHKLLKVHQEGLEATKQTFVGDILPDYPTRHKYLDSAYKIKGRMNSDTPPNINVGLYLTDEQFERIISRRKKVTGETDRDG